MANNLAPDTSEDRADDILEAVRRIPPGHVSTYGDVSPGAPRQAGKVLSMASEQDLPWWRVVRADGSLSQGERQRSLLLQEGVPFRAGRKRVDILTARVPNP